jgi:hypothetical protein
VKGLTWSGRPTGASRGSSDVRARTVVIRRPKADTSGGLRGGARGEFRAAAAREVGARREGLRDELGEDEVAHRVGGEPEAVRESLAGQSNERERDDRADRLGKTG